MAPFYYFADFILAIIWALNMGPRDLNPLAFVKETRQVLVNTNSLVTHN